MSVKPVEIKAWMGDGTEYVVRYYKEADFDAKERECERLRELLRTSHTDGLHWKTWRQWKEARELLHSSEWPTLCKRIDAEIGGKS